MELGRGSGNDIPAAFGPATGPARDHPARLLNDGDECDNVVRLQGRFDDEVDLPRREHGIGVAVSTVAGEADGFFHPVIGGTAQRIEQRRRGGAQRGIRKLGRVAGFNDRAPPGPS